MGWLLLALQAVFWVPIGLRLARRKTPEVTIYDELASSFRVPGLVLCEAGLALIFWGLAARAWSGGLDQHGGLQVIGILFHVAAIALMFWALAVHHSWNIQPRLEPDHQLCMVGPYGMVRHPIYLAFDLLGLGAAIWVPSVAVILGAALLIVSGDLRARAEEKILTEAFGDHYRKYMRRVSRVIPGVY